MPRLWDDTIDAHRKAVRDATLDTAARLVAEEGLRSVTMSRVAEETGIGRATLYKYFPDVEAILGAWHERQVAAHLEHLAAVRDGAGDAREGIEAVLEAYALIAHGAGRHDAELGALVHTPERMAPAHRHLHAMVQEVITAGRRERVVRDDVAPSELTTYCLHALRAASGMSSKAAVRRLVAVTLAGLRPPR